MLVMNPLHPTSKTLLALTLCAVLAVSSFMYLYRLSDNSIYHDEAIHAVVVRIMREGGDWLTMQNGMGLYFRKPPLSFWVRAVTQNVFGENEFTNRISSAAAGIGTAMLIAWWGWEWTRKKSVAFLAGGLYPLMPVTFFHTFRMGITDGLFIFLTTVAAYLFWKSLQRPTLLIAASVVSGLAFMTKSVAALVLPLTALIALAIIRHWPYTWKQLLASLGLFFVIMVPWHAQQLIVHRGEFWREYVVFHIVDRATERIHISPQLHGPLWYFQDIEKTMFPWAWLIPPAMLYGVVHAVRRRKEKMRGPIPIPRGSTDIFLIAWGAGTFLFFTLAATKLNWYLAPGYPALILLIARFFSVSVRRFPWYLWATFGLFVLGYWWRLAHSFRIGTTGFFAMDFLGPRKSTLIVAVVIVVLIVYIVRRMRWWKVVGNVFLYGTLLHFSVFALSSTWHSLNYTIETSFHVFGKYLDANKPNAQVLIGDPNYALNYLTRYYLTGPLPHRTIVPFTPTDVALEQVVSEHPGNVVIMKSDIPIPTDLQTRLRPVASYETFTLYNDLGGTVIR